MDFAILIHHNEECEYIHHPLKFPTVISSIHISPSLRKTTDLWPIQVLAFSRILCKFFYIWCLSLSLTILRSIHLITCIDRFFLLLLLTKKTAMNTPVRVFVWIVDVKLFKKLLVFQSSCIYL